MSQIRVRIEVEAVGNGTDDIATRYPLEFVWEMTLPTAGDNPAFYGDQLQRAIERVARQAVDNLEPFCVLREVR